LDIKPHLVRSWITREDSPEFWARAADVCGLYLDPPDNALVLSVDEKKNIPARAPTRPSRAAAAGRVAQRESEYVRNGMLDTLFAAFNVASGEVVAAEDAASNSAVNFIAFLADIDAMVAADLAVMRAGASVLGEVPATGLPAILVPGVYEGGYNQNANAEYLEAQGAAVIVHHSQLGTLAPVVRELLADPARRRAMSEAARRMARPDAARRLASILTEMAA
jgi:hypothetical protein